LTGFSGGKAASLSDLNVNVPSNDMQIIEDIHLSLCHWFMRFLKGDKNV
jgi:phosphoheptose isomerase